MLSKNGATNFSSHIIFIICIFSVLMVFSNSFADTAIQDFQIDSTRTDSSYVKTSQRGELNDYFFRVIWVTILILGLIILGFYIYKKTVGSQATTSKNQIRVFSRFNLGPKQSLMIVHVENQKLVIGVTEHSINLIKDMGPYEAEDEEFENQPHLSNNFAAILQRLRKEN